MTKEKFSKGYKLLCRFMKEVKIYNYFLEYQKTQRQIVKQDTNDVVKSMGNTSFSAWLEYTKSIYLSHNVYYTFKYWLATFYLEFYDSLPYFCGKEIDISSSKEFGVNAEDRSLAYSPH